MLEENRDLVRRYYELVAGDLQGIDEVVTADFVDHHFPPDMPPGPEGVRQFFTQFIPKFFSELKIVNISDARAFNSPRRPWRR